MRLLLGLLGLGVVVADTPANCMIEDIYGTWTFFIGKATDKHLHYDPYNQIDADDVKKMMTVSFSKPDLVNVIKPANSEGGHFTMIYNEGFEAQIAGNKFFAFNWFQGTAESKDGKYDCTKTVTGYANDILGHNNRPFVAHKGDHSELPTNKHSDGDELQLQNTETAWLNKKYKVDYDLVERINGIKGNSWTATPYENIWNDDMTLREIHQMGGAFVKSDRVKKTNKLQFKPVTNKQDERTTKESSGAFSSFNSNVADKDIPDAWDWRNVNGINFVSPVRSQASCGSCYIFASAAMLEARIRIASNNTQQPILSTQQPLDCSSYSQGCDGGFPYLTAGKFARDFGFVDESCYRYEAKDLACRDAGLKHYMTDEQKKAAGDDWRTGCENRYYSAAYRYVGGYYGNTDAESMKKEIFRHGPVAIGFQVMPDFRYYEGGIYKHTDLQSHINRSSKHFEATNHAVVVVGYGHCDKMNMDFWIVKNSWGSEWGEDGYFRIVRGIDNVAVESMAAGSYPITEPF